MARFFMVLFDCFLSYMGKWGLAQTIWAILMGELLVTVCFGRSHLCSFYRHILARTAAKEQT